MSRVSAFRINTEFVSLGDVNWTQLFKDILLLVYYNSEPST